VEGGFPDAPVEKAGKVGDRERADVKFLLGEYRRCMREEEGDVREKESRACNFEREQSEKTAGKKEKRRRGNLGCPQGGG